MSDKDKIARLTNEAIMWQTKFADNSFYLFLSITSNLILITWIIYLIFLR